MALLHPQLEAFLAVIEEGGFERAAGRLCITPSALSQRIKGLEDRLGAVLVRRSVPAVATPAGEKLLRRAQSMRLLESETLADFRPGEETDRVARITILVNNDSLATWLPEALTDFALHAGSSEKGRQRVALDVRTDDQDHALESLRNGTAVTVVTSESAPFRAPARPLSEPCGMLPLHRPTLPKPFSAAIRTKRFGTLLSSVSTAKTLCRNAFWRAWASGRLNVRASFTTHRLPPP